MQLDYKINGATRLIKCKKCGCEDIEKTFINFALMEKAFIYDFLMDNEKTASVCFYPVCYKCECEFDEMITLRLKEKRLKNLKFNLILEKEIK